MKTQPTIGYLGLGKMGMNMVLRLTEAGVPIIAWNRGEDARREARSLGIAVEDSLESLIAKLPAPRTLWLMVPSAAVDDMLATLLPLIAKGDTIIDGGNSYFEDTLRRGKLLKKKGVHFIDAGISGGPGGARSGACVMVGGEANVVQRYEPIFCAAAAPNAYLHAGPIGAGHFVKMVHNGIEYGMMQAIAEGFEVLKKSSFKLPLAKVAKLYNNKSVIESRLVGWLEGAYAAYGEDLKAISSTVAHTGEGEWTIKTAKKLGVPTPIIAGSLAFRKTSGKKPSYAGKVLSALRNQFGGHAASAADATKHSRARKS